MGTCNRILCIWWYLGLFEAVPVSPRLPAWCWPHTTSQQLLYEKMLWACAQVEPAFSYPLLYWYSSQPSSWFLLTDFSKRRILIPKYSPYFKNPSCKDKTHKHLKPEKGVFLFKHRNLILTEAIWKQRKTSVSYHFAMKKLMCIAKLNRFHPTLYI